MTSTPSSTNTGGKDSHGLPRSPDHKGPTLLTGPKVFSALGHFLAAPVLLYCIKNDVGRTILKKVLGEDSTAISSLDPVIQGPRLDFYTFLLYLYATRWVVGSFTLNGGGALPWDVAIMTVMVHFVVQFFPYVVWTAYGEGVPPELTAVDYLAGALAIMAGIFQHGAELQRLMFKLDPHNKGKLHTSGLFRYARHINHFGHCLNEVAVMLATRTFLAHLPWVLICFYGLGEKVIPETEQHLKTKYKDQYTKYTEQVPYRMVPLIY